MQTCASLNRWKKEESGAQSVESSKAWSKLCGFNCQTRIDCFFPASNGSGSELFQELSVSYKNIRSPTAKGQLNASELQLAEDENVKQQLTSQQRSLVFYHFGVDQLFSSSFLFHSRSGFQVQPVKLNSFSFAETCFLFVTSTKRLFVSGPQLPAPASQ